MRMEELLYVLRDFFFVSYHDNPQLALSRDDENMSAWWRFREVEDPRKTDGKVLTIYLASLPIFPIAPAIRLIFTRRQTKLTTHCPTFSTLIAPRTWMSWRIKSQSSYLRGGLRQYLRFANFEVHAQGTAPLNTGYKDLYGKLHKPHTAESLRKWTSQHTGFH